MSPLNWTVLLLVLGVVGFWLLGRWLRKSSARAAHKMMRSYHGDLPPIEMFKGGRYSPAFLEVVTEYYIAAADKRIADQARAEKERERKEKWTAWMLKSATPIDPDTANDCPECDNGLPHESCRSGWKDELRENVRKYAVAKFGAMPAWKAPCDTCGSNCGQCASSHCGICGVKPRDGACDLVQHEAYKLHRESSPDRAKGRCVTCRKETALERVFDPKTGRAGDWSCVGCGETTKRG